MYMGGSFNMAGVSTSTRISSTINLILITHLTIELSEQVPLNSIEERVSSDYDHILNAFLTTFEDPCRKNPVLSYDEAMKKLVLVASKLGKYTAFAKRITNRNDKINEPHECDNVCPNMIGVEIFCNLQITSLSECMNLQLFEQGPPQNICFCSVIDVASKEKSFIAWWKAWAVVKRNIEQGLIKMNHDYHSCLPIIIHPADLDKYRKDGRNYARYESCVNNVQTRYWTKGILSQL